VGIGCGSVSVDCEQHRVGIDAKASVDDGQDAQKEILLGALLLHKQLSDELHFVFLLALF
jgi:hypothetical protein